jgi:hypothetical protein
MISISESEVFLQGIPPGCPWRCDPGSPVASPSEAISLPPANAQVYLDNIQVMHRLPSISTWVEIEDIFNAEFDRSFYIEDFDVAAAASAAIANSKDAFDRAGG